MKMNIATRNLRRLAAPLLALLPLALPAQTTGWKQTGAGPYDYNDPANWVGGTVNDINGRWDESLTLATHQVVVFGVDTVLTYPLHFGYAGPFDLRLRGTGGNRTLTLGGDVTTAMAGRTISLGSVAVDQGLDVNLGGAKRIFNLTSALQVYNTASGGDIAVEGSNVFRLRGPYGKVVGGGVTIRSGAFIHFERETETDPGTTRTGDLRLEASTLRFSARSGVNATETVGGTLTLAPSPGIGGTPQIHGYNNTKNIRLHIQRVAQDGWGIVNVGINGGTLGATDFTSGLNITLGEGGDPIGTGTDGTPTCPVLPWARYNGRLMTYHATRGLRVMDRATEFNTYTNGYVGSVTTPGENLFIAAGTIVEFTNAVNVVNSIETGYGPTFRLHVTNGVLQVTSGAIFFDADSMGYLNANLDFGAHRGYIVDRQGKGQTLQGSIAGSSGLTIASYATGNNTTSGGTGITLSSQNNTYQGDTHIHGRISANAANFFPSGSRLGDLYVHGYFQFGNASQTVNALNGAGYIYLANSYTVALTVGDNDANGDYSGRIERSNGTLSLTKIGAGTQRFSGYCFFNGATTVNGGTLVLDGSFTNSAVTVNTGATLRGAGSVAKATTAITVKSGGTLAPGSTNGIGTLTVSQGNVAFESGAALTVTAGSTGVGLLDVAGSVTGAVSVPVTVEGEGTGKWKVVQASTALAPTFTSVTPGTVLTLENGGTELWVERLAKGTVFFVR